jgi:DNA-directed RNA polymerase subunit beta'
MDDLVVPTGKEAVITRASKDVSHIIKQYEEGDITDGERYNKIIDAWTRATNEVGELMMEGLRKDRDGFNPIFMMSTRIARQQGPGPPARRDARSHGEAPEEDHWPDR